MASTIRMSREDAHKLATDAREGVLRCRRARQETLIKECQEYKVKYKASSGLGRAILWLFNGAPLDHPDEEKRTGLFKENEWDRTRLFKLTTYRLAEAILGSDGQHYDLDINDVTELRNAK